MFPELPLDSLHSLASLSPHSLASPPLPRRPPTLLPSFPTVTALSLLLPALSLSLPTITALSPCSPPTRIASYP